MAERSAKKVIRCAIYTRKSTEEGLEQNFNSLHAQREACESYIKSQCHEGWTLITTAYDDGGYSGGSMDRPALKMLLADIDTGKVDIIVVYKVDRLTRSLADFAKMVERFDARGVSFVSVTQQFNTTSSMGRLTLNVLLSFAQFEREVTGERIRDKIAASKKKGIWMGGMPPPGYRVVERKLVIHEPEAVIVRKIFSLYCRYGNVCTVHEKLIAQKIIRPAAVAGTGLQYGNRPFTRGMIYALLSNPIYIGEIQHAGERYIGQHQAIIRRKFWEETQKKLATNAHARHVGFNAKEPSLLTGLLFDGQEAPFRANHGVKNTKRYRYYVSTSAAEQKPTRIPAFEVEGLVLKELRKLLNETHRLMALLGIKKGRTRLLHPALNKAKDLAKQLASTLPQDQRVLLLQMLKRIVLTKNEIQIQVRRAAIIQPELPAARYSDNSILTIKAPVVFNLRGVETRLAIPGEPNANPSLDPALIKAVARAHAWFEDLASGRVKDFGQLGKRENMTRSMVGRISLLAFLNPNLVEQILDGRQPKRLTARRLIRQEFPESWRTQDAVFRD